MNSALFIDLPNFYSRLLKSGIEKPKILKEYFLNWLDFDLLANSLAENFSGIWAFYSGERIGPSSERIEGKYLQNYIRRINSLMGVTARDVNIPGEQREPISFKCENCGKEGTAQAISEKGVDASLTVHLFDTMDSWDTAFLLSGDADFVPAVSSLRRRGKIVIGVGFSDASLALVQECYQYINIAKVFLKQDLLTYLIFKKDGLAEKWLTFPILHPDSGEKSSHVRVAVNWRPDMHAGKFVGDVQEYSVPKYKITFYATSNQDLTGRLQLMKDLKTKFPDSIDIKLHEKECDVSIKDVINGKAIIRNLETLQGSIKVPNNSYDVSGDNGFVIDYALDNDGKYQIIEIR